MKIIIYVLAILCICSTIAFSEVTAKKVMFGPLYGTYKGVEVALEFTTEGYIIRRLSDNKTIIGLRFTIENNFSALKLYGSERSLINNDPSYQLTLNKEGNCYVNVFFNVCQK